MTLPTREEIRSILAEFVGPLYQPLDAMADALLARLRPASLTAEERMERAAKEFDEAFDEAQRAGRIDPLTPSETNRLINTMQLAQVERERDLLRASLTRKDEALRACVEALEKASCVEAKLFPDHYVCVNCGAWYDYETKECSHLESCYVGAALARAQGSAKA